MLAATLAALLQRVQALESKMRTGRHGLGWDAVRWVSLREAADVFGVGRDTVMHWARTGRIPAVGISRSGSAMQRWRIPAWWLLSLPDLQQAYRKANPPKNKRAPGRFVIERAEFFTRMRRARAEKQRLLAKERAGELPSPGSA